MTNFPAVDSNPPEIGSIHSAARSIFSADRSRSADGNSIDAWKQSVTRLPQHVSELEAKFAALDDLVIQFDESATGAEFVNAWFNARQVADLGRRAAKPTPAPASPPAKM